MHISSLIFLFEVRLPSAFDRNSPALRDEVGELVPRERDSVPHFAALHYLIQHFIDGLFREPEIPHSSTLSFYFPMVWDLLAVDSFGMTYHFYEGGGGRSGDSPAEIYNWNLTWANRRFFSLFVPNRKCHSELIHHAQLHIPGGVRWINEESHACISV